MKRMRVCAPVTVALLGVACTSVTPGGGGQTSPSRWSVELVSASADGGGSGDNFSRDAVFSPDGTKLAFASAASNLVPGDTNGAVDVFVRDLTTGQTTLVSANADGTGSGNRDADHAAFSPDGTKVAFDSMASNLGPNDTNGTRDVFVRDLESGTTTLVSYGPSGDDSANEYSSHPAFSPDGSRIVFVSGASDLGFEDNNGLGDVFVRDFTTGETTLVSANPAGAAGDLLSQFPVFSPDGTMVAFSSMSRDLAPNDADALPDLFVRDLTTSSTTLVSVNKDGTGAANSSPWDATFSPDSTRIAWRSLASDLVDNDTNGQDDIFVRDLVAGETSLVSVNAAGTASANGGSRAHAFSPDGTRIAFASSASDLAPTDGNGTGDVFIRDLAAGETTLVSTNAAGTASADRGANEPAFSPDGERLVMFSASSDLGPADSNGWGDVYLEDLASGTSTLISANVDGTNGGNAVSLDAAFSPDGTRIVFKSDASDLAPTDTNGRMTDIYVAFAPTTSDLAITADTANRVRTGRALTLTATITNNGPDAARQLFVDVTLPAGVTVSDDQAAASGCTAPAATPGSLACRLPTLAPEASAELTIVSTVAAPGGTTVSVDAAVRSASADPDPQNDRATASTRITGPR